MFDYATHPVDAVGHASFVCCHDALQDTPEAPSEARERLRLVGPMSYDEKILTATMLLCIALWILGGVLAVAPVSAALLGLSILLFTGVLKWKVGAVL